MDSLHAAGLRTGIRSGRSEPVPKQITWNAAKIMTFCAFRRTGEQLWCSAATERKEPGAGHRAGLSNAHSKADPGYRGTQTDKVRAAGTGTKAAPAARTKRSCDTNRLPRRNPALSTPAASRNVRCAGSSAEPFSTFQPYRTERLLQPRSMARRMRG